MRGESLGISVFKSLILFGIFILLGMLYWSSLLVEEKLIDVDQHINKLEKTVNKLAHAPRTTSFVASTQRETAPRPHIDPNLPNLLSEDVFYAKTLPNMLGDSFIPTGIRRSATIGKPNNLLPFSSWGHIRNWISMCQLTVATLEFGKFETMAPSMAIKMEERVNEKTGLKEYWVHLRDNVFWEPLEQRHFGNALKLAEHFLHSVQVTSHDFKFYFDAVMNPFVQESGAVATRNYIGDIEEFRIIDDLTFVVRWKAEEKRQKYVAKQLTGSLSPLPRFIYQYFSDGTKISKKDKDPDFYRKDSVWAENFSQHFAKNVIASCGPWIFDGMTEREIRFRRNPNHFNPYEVLVEGVHFAFKETPDAIWQDFKAGKLDTYALRPTDLLELEEFLQTPAYLEQKKQGAGIERVDYVGRTYFYIGWNMAEPLFAEEGIRQALTLAIDRQRMIDQNLNGMGIEITGPFFVHSPSNDKSIKAFPYNKELAKRKLEELGWFDTDGDGVLDKEIDGVRTPFRFELTYYVKSVVTRASCEFIATLLKEIGIDCQLHGVDIADLTQIFEDKSFDAIYMGWSFGDPPEEPKQLWHSSGALEKGSSNAVGFVNKEADKIIEELQYANDHSKRITLYHRFHKIIYDAQPYTFLYNSKSTLLYRSYLKNVFIPADRPDIIPGGNAPEPDSSVFYLEERP